MAVDSGILNSGLRRSAGNATWRRVRGRTIISQKRQSGKNTIQTRAAGGLIRTYREALFFIMSAFADGMQNSINESFEQTKYGSRRNAFFKKNYSAVEKGLNASPLGLAVLDAVMHNVSFTGVTGTIGEESVTFGGFDASSFSLLFRAASAAGVEGSYIRSDIAGTVYQGFDEEWGDGDDPGTAKVNEIAVTVGTSTSSGQNIVSVVVVGVNLPNPITYSVRVGSPNATPLTGTWAANRFTPSGESATQRWASAMTVYITDGTRVMFSRLVNFYSGNPSAGGE